MSKTKKTSVKSTDTNMETSKLNIEEVLTCLAQTQSYAEISFEVLVKELPPLEQEIAQTARQLRFVQIMKTFVTNLRHADNERLAKIFDDSEKNYSSQLKELKAKRMS